MKRADHDRRRSSKLVDDKVGKFVADKLKMQLFIGVRDNLKEKLEEIKTHQKKMKEWMGKENMEV